MSDITKINYYNILGVSETSSLQEIKRAYQNKLKQYHPDKIEQTKENKLKYNLIRTAGDTLCDASERLIYDNDFKNKDNELDFIRFKKDDDSYVTLLTALKQTDDAIKTICSEKNGTDKIDADELARRCDDLMLQRNDDDTEINYADYFENDDENNDENNEYNNEYTDDNLMKNFEALMLERKNDDIKINYNEQSELYDDNNAHNCDAYDVQNNYASVNNNSNKKIYCQKIINIEHDDKQLEISHVDTLEN